MSWSTFLADVVLCAHFAYVAFVVVGFLLTVIGGIARWGWVRNPWFRGVHVATILIVATEAVLELECPLTILEKALRDRTGEKTSEMSFVAEWLDRLLFLPGPPWVFTVAYCAFFALVVLWLFLVPPRRPGRAAARP